MVRIGIGWLFAAVIRADVCMDSIVFKLDCYVNKIVFLFFVRRDAVKAPEKGS